jgi:type IV secretion system protein VirB1
MLHALALAALTLRCAPEIAPMTMTAIVQVESGGDPLAIGDNTARRSYHPSDRASAEALAHRLIEAGHSVDLGMAQIDNVNFARLAVNARMLFDPCMNLRAGAEILSEDYALAQRRFGSGQIALRHAIGMYNTGHLDRGATYVRRVLAVAGIRDRARSSQRVIVVLDPLHSPLLIKIPIAHVQALGVRHAHIMPARAPILVTTARPSRIVVF